VEARLPAIRCPVAVVQGSDDEYATAEHARRIAAKVGGPATLHLLPGCGHAPHVELPDALVEIAVELSQTVNALHPS
jgi:pimeloyl-ACP methyl ester carboxylesterase